MIVWVFGDRLVLGDLELHEIPGSVALDLWRSCIALWRDNRAETGPGGYGWAFKLWGQKDGQENG